MNIRFVNAKIFRPSGFVDGELFVKDGKISTPLEDHETVDCKGGYLAPGLIDLQINGIEDIDFTIKLDLERASQLLAKRGVTSYLATIISQPISRYQEILFSFPRERGSCLGLHLEGPHLNPTLVGGHPKEAINPVCAVEFWDKVLDPSLVRLFTLAPELERADELIAVLHKKKIITSCGHSDATREQMDRAKSLGLSFVTHLFNAMKPFHHRKSGPISFVLGRRELPFSLIVDDMHLHADTVSIAYNANREGLYLVSDASAKTLAGVELNESSQLLGTQTLAGSRRSLLDAVRLLHKQAPCTLWEAISCASLKPATLLGIQRQKGLLEVGYDADIILLSKELELQATLLGSNLESY